MLGFHPENLLSKAKQFSYSNILLRVDINSSNDPISQEILDDTRMRPITKMNLSDTALPFSASHQASDAALFLHKYHTGMAS